MSLYRPLNEEEALKARFNLLDDGEYDAIVKIATRKISNSGNVMGELVVSVFDTNGEAHSIVDYLVFTSKMLWKTLHFCKSAGQEDIYNSGEFTPELAEGQRVRVVVGKKQGNEIPPDKLNGKPLGTRYPEKNVVQDYVPFAGPRDSLFKPQHIDQNDLPF